MNKSGRGVGSNAVTSGLEGLDDEPDAVGQHFKTLLNHEWESSRARPVPQWQPVDIDEADMPVDAEDPSSASCL